MELAYFLIQQCEDRKISLRGLSISAGLSPATVYNIVAGRFRPRIASLNALADYLGVQREYLWTLAGLLKNSGYSTKKYGLNDPQVYFYFTQVKKLPEEEKAIALSVIKIMLSGFKRRGSPGRTLHPATPEPSP